ncbi:MAG: DUF4097 family beta strand repeat protein [Armatimonadetes bacterium]|nr:DUF4097 family beta strand repeat protein [Armatimonadota bacterium]
MKEEVKRIMKLVQEGKLSPDDAAELIEAFNDAPVETPEEEKVGAGVGGEQQTATAKGEDPISKFIGSIEKIGKDVAKNVNWDDIAKQVRQGVHKGVDAIKQAADDAKKGGGFSVFFGSAQTKHVELPLDVPTGKVLRLELKSGDVVINGGAETGLFVVDATFRSYDENEAKRLADIYTPMLEESDHQVVFRQPEGANIDTDLTINVPSGVPVEIKVASGDVTVKGTSASVKIDGSSGDVEIHEAKGSVTVAQRSGNVKVENADTSILNVETKSGDISLRDVSGVLEIKTSSGDVKVMESAPKTLSIEAASGDVAIELAEGIKGSVNVTAVSGDVKMTLADGNDCRVSLSTLRGTVSCNLELKDEAREGQKVTGRLGKGNGTLDVSVVTGSVSLGPYSSVES